VGRLANDVVDAWEARIVSNWRRAFKVVRAHKGDPLAQWRALEPFEREADVMEEQPTYELPSALTPIFLRTAVKILAGKARQRIDEALVLLVEYRQRHGSFPSTLAELPGGPVIDPFTAKPLIYRKTPEGFILY